MARAGPSRGGKPGDLWDGPSNDGLGGGGGLAHAHCIGFLKAFDLDGDDHLNTTEFGRLLRFCFALAFGGAMSGEGPRGASATTPGSQHSRGGGGGHGGAKAARALRVQRRAGLLAYLFEALPSSGDGGIDPAATDPTDFNFTAARPDMNVDLSGNGTAADGCPKEAGLPKGFLAAAGASQWDLPWRSGPLGDFTNRVDNGGIAARATEAAATESEGSAPRAASRASSGVIGSWAAAAAARAQAKPAERVHLIEQAAGDLHGALGASDRARRRGEELLAAAVDSEALAADVAQGLRREIAALRRQLGARAGAVEAATVR
jgi:hypothetical protein